MNTNPVSALLLIDMQKGMAFNTLPPRNNPRAEENMAALLMHWRTERLPVVHVRHISRTPSSVFWPGQAGAEFQDRFVPLAHEHVMEKNITCAFTASGLERWLHQRGIASVVIAGVSTNFSVEATSRSASQLGFKTTVVADATFTFELQDLYGVTLVAEQVHTMALSNLQSEYATVTTTREVIQATSPGAAPAHA